MEYIFSLKNDHVKLSYVFSSYRKFIQSASTIFLHFCDNDKLSTYPFMYYADETSIKVLSVEFIEELAKIKDSKKFNIETYLFEKYGFTKDQFILDKKIKDDLEYSYELIKEKYIETLSFLSLKHKTDISVFSLMQEYDKNIFMD